MLQMGKSNGNYPPDAKSGVIAIIGAKGRMARYYASRLIALGTYDVRTASRPLSREKLAPVLSGTDLVLLCIPADTIESVVRDFVAPNLDGHTILADITSVKTYPMASMREHYKGPVVGTHPLYGPRLPVAGEPPRSTAIVLDANHEAATHYVEQLFAIFGDTTFRTTDREHDRAMAMIHNMNFLTTVAYFATLDPPEELKPFILPSLRRRAEAARITLTDDADMLFRLLHQNPMTNEVMARFHDVLASATDHEVLSKLIERASKWVKDTDNGGKTL